MDTWEVKGTLRVVVSYEPCDACNVTWCEGHVFSRDVTQAVEAHDEDDALDRARLAVIREMHIPNSGAIENSHYTGPEPTAINVSALARDRAALAAWNMALPISGGPPIEWGRKSE